jgi:hypothetical protein
LTHLDDRSLLGSTPDTPLHRVEGIA